MSIPKIWPIGVLMVVLMAQQSLSISLDEDDSEDFYEETVVLKTKMGALRGHKEVVDSKVSYYAFKGIRYAKAPTKERRFQVRQIKLKSCYLFSNYKFNSHLNQKPPGWEFAVLCVMVTYALNSVSLPTLPSVMKIVLHSMFIHPQ